MKLIVFEFLLLLFATSLDAQSLLADDLFPWEDIESFDTRIEALQGPKIQEYVSPIFTPGLCLYLYKVH